MNRTFGVQYHPNYSVCQTELSIRETKHSFHTTRLFPSVYFTVGIRPREPGARFDERKVRQIKK